MPVLTVTEIDTLIDDIIVTQVTVDDPVPAAEKLRSINDAYGSIWEASGGSIKTVASATLWTSAQTATGIVVGALADIRQIKHLFASNTSSSTGVSANDSELDPVDLARIQRLRKSNLTGTYDRPKEYAVTRMGTATAADVGKLQLDYWPSVTGFYFPAIYIPFFTPATAINSDKPDVNDLESYDIAYLSAADLMQRIGRPDLVPGVLLKVSEATAKALERKLKSMVAADQDK